MKNDISKPAAELRRLAADTGGAVFLEFTLFVAVFFTLLFGIIDFTVAFYQWNAATKAVQLGARLAAVSDPVAPELATITGVEGGSAPGDPMPEFSAVCRGGGGGGAPECTCTGFSCTYSATSMDNLVYGRGNTSCMSPNDVGFSPRNVGMCNFFWRVTPANVVVEYRYTGLGYAGRPGAEYAVDQFASHAVPTVSVRLGAPAEPLPFIFVMVGAFMGYDQIPIPGLLSTVTGEDLSGQ